VSVSKIKSTLPKTESGLNGLDEVAAEMASEPRRKRVVILLVDVGEVKHEYAADTDEEIPPGVTVGMRIRRAESLTGLDEQLALRLLVRAHERRNGRITLPLDTDLSMLPDNRQDGGE
jgi:hypothetical protein